MLHSQLCSVPGLELILEAVSRNYFPPFPSSLKPEISSPGSVSCVCTGALVHEARDTKARLMIGGLIEGSSSAPFLKSTSESQIQQCLSCEPSPRVDRTEEHQGPALQTLPQEPGPLGNPEPRTSCLKPYFHHYLNEHCCPKHSLVKIPSACVWLSGFSG